MNRFEQNDASHLFFPLWAEQNIKYEKPGGEICNFEMRPHLVQIAEAMDNHKYVIVNKYPQSAVTNFTIARALWDAIWHPDQDIMFLSRTDREAMNLYRIMKQFINHLPEQPVLGKVKPSRCTNHEICFEDVGSKVSFITPEPRKDKATTHLYIDEAAFIPDMDNWWKSAYPCLATGGKCTAVSTPNGAQGWFYNTFLKACDGTNQFFPINVWDLLATENCDAKLKKLDDKESLIREVMDEYNAVLTKALIQFFLDGKPIYMTPEGIEKYARNLQEMAQ